jgi:hypothetical protein
LGGPPINRAIVENAVFLLGLGLLVVGGWMIHPSLAFLLPGGLICGGMTYSRLRGGE